MTVRRARRRQPSGAPLESLQLEALRQRLKAGEQNALDAFWSEIAEQGAPLIEPLPGGAESLVTFLYRGEPPHVRGVQLFGGPAGGGKPELAQLPGTDLWFTTYRLPNDLRTLYKLRVAGTSPEGSATEEVQLDALNPRVFETAFANSPGWSDSMLELPGAVPQPWVAPRPEVPTGTIVDELLASRITGHTQRVWLYTPAGYAPEHGPYPLLVLLDGQAYVASGGAPTTLDNLIASEAIPPTVAVLVSIPEDDPEARLGLYTCSDRFNEFLAHELMPWIRERVNVTLDPRWLAIGGSSLGGLAAAYAGLRLYFLFGNVLSQSGSYWWSLPEDREPEWLARQYATASPRPLRFFLTVGLLEVDVTPGGGPSQVVVNRHLRDVLTARGYPVTLAEYREGHNFLSWRGSLADGLIALLAPTPPLPASARTEPPEEGAGA